jgi:ABC-2 type transport system ATP-binding protein
MMEPMIIARDLTKSFRTPTKQPGLRGAITHLIQPRYEDKIVVQAIDLSLAKGESVTQWRG